MKMHEITHWRPVKGVHSRYRQHGLQTWEIPMTHAYHDSLEGYESTQIWHDGCAECEARGKDIPRSVGTLDDFRLQRAWARMELWCRDDPDTLATLSHAEIALLRFLQAAKHVVERLDHRMDQYR